MKGWWALSAGVVLVVVAGTVASHVLTKGSDDVIPSAEQAEAAIEYAFAHAGDGPDVFCEISAGAGDCRALLAAAPAPPVDAPEILCSQAYEPSAGDLRAGRAVRVTGTDGTGTRYLSDVLVLADGDGTVLLNPVFWDSTTIDDAGRGDLSLDADCPDGGASGSSESPSGA